MERYPARHPSRQELDIGLGIWTTKKKNSNRNLLLLTSSFTTELCYNVLNNVQSCCCIGSCTSFETLKGFTSASKLSRAGGAGPATSIQTTGTRTNKGVIILERQDDWSQSSQAASSKQQAVYYLLIIVHTPVDEPPQRPQRYRRLWAAR